MNEELNGIFGDIYTLSRMDHNLGQIKPDSSAYNSTITPMAKLLILRSSDK